MIGIERIGASACRRQRRGPLGVRIARRRVTRAAGPLDQHAAEIDGVFHARRRRLAGGGVGRDGLAPQAARLVALAELRQTIGVHGVQVP